MRILINFLLILFLLFTLCSCATVKPVAVEVVTEDTKTGTITIKKSTMEKVLSELIYQKQQLMECLEREKK